VPAQQRHADFGVRVFERHVPDLVEEADADLGLLVVVVGEQDGAAVEGEVGIQALRRGVQDDGAFEEGLRNS